MAYENYCISCFQEKTSGAFCPHCGFEEPQERKHALLPARTVLRERYLIGEVLLHDRSSISYKAFDLQKKEIVEVQEYFPRQMTYRETDGLQIRAVSPKFEEPFAADVQKVYDSGKRMLHLQDCEQVIHVFDVFTENSTVYVVSEYLEGMRLSGYLESCGGTLDLDTALSVLLPVLDGLQRIHSEGLVHRGITPDTILLTADNRIKIIQFQSLKEGSPYQENQMTVHYSPGYAPAEQYMSHSRYGAFTDVYAAGAVLYRMLMGAIPPDAIARSSGNSALDMPPEIPEHVRLAVEKAMEPDDQMRFKTAAEFKQTLLGQKTITDVGGEIHKVRQRKEMRIVIFLSVVLAVLIAALIYMILNEFL